MIQPSKAQQAAWAKGQAQQRRRILSRLKARKAAPAAIAAAERQLLLAEAAFATLTAVAKPPPGPQHRLRDRYLATLAEAARCAP